MEKLFAYSFTNTEEDAEKNIPDISPHLTTIDAAIQKCAPEWPIDKIAKIDLAILRLAAHELLIAKSQPPKVVIDEAVELAKQFGNTNSAKFVNGVLGSVLQSI
jgi:transcription antitermination protein NusB